MTAWIIFASKKEFIFLEARAPSIRFLFSSIQHSLWKCSKRVHFKKIDLFLLRARSLRLSKKCFIFSDKLLQSLRLLQTDAADRIEQCRWDPQTPTTSISSKWRTNALSFLVTFSPATIIWIQSVWFGIKLQKSWSQALLNRESKRWGKLSLYEPGYYQIWNFWRLHHFDKFSGLLVTQQVYIAVLCTSFPI